MAAGEVFYDEEAVLGDHPILMSPVFLALIVASYATFVKVTGPRLMAERPPYSLKYPMLLYNATMVAVNLSIIARFVRGYEGYAFFGLGYFWKHACHPLERRTNPLVIAYMNGMIDFYISKILDLTDTVSRRLQPGAMLYTFDYEKHYYYKHMVFLVLRKKDSQLSFLHFFHHLATLILTWLSLQVVRDEIGALLGVINSSVHVIMYSYYFLAALGSTISKYLWWKRYLTQIQIIQLVIFICIIGYLTVNNCEITRGMIYMWGSFITMNTLLFIDFYKKSYLK